MKRTYTFGDHVVMVDLAEVQAIESPESGKPVLILRGGGHLRLPTISEENLDSWERLVDDWES